MKIHNIKILLVTVVFFFVECCLCSCVKQQKHAKQQEIDLNRYVSINYEGKNGGGTASYVFDLVKFEKDYSGKIKLTDNAKVAGINDLERSVAHLLFDTCVAITVDSDEEYLSNGDAVRLSWNCNESAAIDYFNCKLVHKDIEEQASGLEEPNEVDPFQYACFSTSFYSPFANASLLPCGEDPIAYGIKFSLNKSSKLKTGEIVKATASYAEGEKKFIHDFGCRFSQTEKEYTIDSTTRFVSEIDDVQYKYLDYSGTDFYWDGWRKIYYDYTCVVEEAECYITTDDVLDKRPTGIMIETGYYSILVTYRHYQGRGEDYWCLGYLCDYYVDENEQYGFLPTEGEDDEGVFSSAEKFNSLNAAKMYVKKYLGNHGYVLYDE